jgi:ankyrin repeat protein
MSGFLVMAQSWQTYVAALLMLVASSVYLIGELHHKGVWIILGFFAPAVLVLLWALTVPEAHETFVPSGRAFAFGFVALTLVAMPLPLNVTGLVIAVRRSLAAGAISPLRLLPMASATLAFGLLVSAWLPGRWGGRLKEAIEGGQLEAVRSLVHGSRDANREIPGESDYPLHLAVSKGRASIVAYLLGQGADVARKKDDDRYTALTALIKDSHVSRELGPEYDEVVALLIDGGSPVTSENLWGIFQLGVHAKSVAALNRRLFTPEKIQENPLELAWHLATASHLKENDVVEAFLAAGGGVDFRDAKGRPLLLNAFEGENDELAQSLMRRGADVTARTTPPTIEEEDEEKRHEFRETDGRDHLGGLDERTVRMFFAKAPSLRLDKRFPYTPPLNEAAEKGNVKVMALLLAKGADIDAMSYLGTPLHGAVSKGRAEAVRFLLAHGADVNRADSSDETALMTACERHPELALILLDHGARMSGRELARASRAGHRDLVKALVKRGAHASPDDSDEPDESSEGAGGDDSEP